MSYILANVFNGHKDTVKCSQSGVVKTSEACIGELQTTEEKVCVRQQSDLCYVCVCFSVCVVSIPYHGSILWNVESI